MLNRNLLFNLAGSAYWVSRRALYPTYGVLNYRFFSNMHNFDDKVFYSNLLKTKMQNLESAFDQLSIPKAERAKLAQLLLAHHTVFNPNNKEIKNKYTKITSYRIEHFQMVATELEKIINEIYATPKNPQQKIPPIKDQTENLELQKKDFAIILAELIRLKAAPSDIKIIASIVADNDKMIEENHAAIHAINYPNQRFFKMLDRTDRLILNALVSKDGNIITLTEDINSFEKYKTCVLEIQDMLQSKKLVTHLQCEASPFRFRLHR